MTEVMDQADNMHWTINNYCRLCANIDDNMVSIYDDQGADHMLENKIKMHLPFINISKNDLLPKQICYHCASTVLVWNELYECSSDADQKLRNLFEESLFDQSKNEPYDDIGIDVPDKDFIGGSIEYEEISEVNIFNKNTRSDKTLNELDKIPSTSKTDTILNDEHKPSVIEEEEEERLNPILKSEISDLFNGEVGDNDSEDNNMYLNAAGIDDDISGLMNCHRLEDMAATEDDECGGEMVPKREYLVNDEDDEDESSRNISALLRNDDDQHHQEHSNSSTVISDSISKIDDDGAGKASFKAVIVNGTSRCRRINRSLLVKNECNDDDDEDDEDVDSPMSMEMNQLYANSSTGLIDVSSNNDDEDNDNDNDNGGEDNMCQICATVFKTRYNLLRHFQKRHPEYKMYECDLCRISFQSIEEFKDHLEEKHSKVDTAHSLDSKQVRFACDVCGNMYKNKASAMNHLLTHTAKKNVHCTQCDFSCYTKQQLGVHQTKHDKRFRCDICNKRFAQKSQLDVHINAVHYNQRPYVCTLCKKSFKTKGSHDAHMIVHTDTRNYQCPHCDKKCRKRYDLTLHIRTHTGEKPFKCSVCGRGFVQMCDTRKHEMLHFKPGKRKNVLFSPSENANDLDDE